MKLLFLPPKPLLTKKGTVRKRARGLTPGRLFFADGRELPAVASITVESEPKTLMFEPRTVPSAKYRATRVVLELLNPKVEIIDQVPTKARKAGAA